MWMVETFFYIFISNVNWIINFLIPLFGIFFILLNFFFVLIFFFFHFFLLKIIRRFFHLTNIRSFNDYTIVQLLFLLLKTFILNDLIYCDCISSGIFMIESKVIAGI